MKTLIVSMLAALAMASPGAAETVTMERGLGDIVAVQDVTHTGEQLSGTLVNRSDEKITEVKLEVLHQFLWKDERHPGPDDPSYTDTVVVREPIPPGGSVTFTQPLAPVPARSDGTFETRVIPRNVVQVGEPPAAPVAPAAP